MKKAEPNQQQNVILENINEAPSKNSSPMNIQKPQKLKMNQIIVNKYVCIFIFILLTIIPVICAFVTWYYYGKEQAIKLANNPTHQISITPTPPPPTPTQSSDSTWQIYENEELGFKFKYPSTFKANIYKASLPRLYIEIFNPEDQLKSDHLPVNLTNYFELRITQQSGIVEQPQNKLRLYIKEIDPLDNMSDYPHDPNGKLNIYNYTNTNKIQGVRGSITSDIIRDTVDRFVFYDNINSINYFGIFDLRHISLEDKNKINEYREIYDKILNSFEFTK